MNEKKIKKILSTKILIFSFLYLLILFSYSYSEDLSVGASLDYERLQRLNQIGEARSQRVDYYVSSKIKPLIKKQKKIGLSFQQTAQKIKKTNSVAQKDPLQNPLFF